MDYGIVVLYFMRQLAFGDAIEKIFKNTMLMKFMVHMIDTFLKNKGSINPCKNMVKM